MTAAGIDAQIGYAEEGTYGTFETPTRFIEFTDEDLHLEINRIDSAGIRAGRKTLHRWAPGSQRVMGSFTQEFAPENSGLLLEHLFGGSAVTAGANPYTHTFTPALSLSDGLTIQVGRPDIGGTVRAFSYLGMMCTGFEFTAAVDEYLKLKTDWFGTDEDTSESLATASYPSTMTPFVFTHGEIRLAGAAYDVTEFSLAGDNNLKTDRHFIRGTTPALPKQAIANGLRDYTGTINSDFIDLAAYNRFVNGAEAALVMDFNAGAAAILEITMNVRFDGNTPTVGSREVLEFELPYKVVSGTDDPTALTAVLTNADVAV